MHILDRTMSRSDLVDLFGASNGPIHFERCAFDGADLSDLTFRDCTFFRSSAAEASFRRARLENSRWLGGKRRGIDFGAAQLTDARFKDSDFNNSSWARAKLASSMFDSVKLTGAIVRFPALQRPNSNARHLAGQTQARPGCMSGLDMADHRLAIFQADHASSSLSFGKIASSLF
jgi:uncharacterized protein YjbI with pentapeptide repeats